VQVRLPAGRARARARLPEISSKRFARGGIWRSVTGVRPRAHRPAISRGSQGVNSDFEIRVPYLRITRRAATDVGTWQERPVEAGSQIR